MPDRMPREGLPLPITQLGNYRLLRRIGQGGFAEVYLGKHIHLDTFAAIKLLKTQLDRSDFEKFRKEARFVASLRHPNIIKLIDFGIDPDTGTPYLIMDYAPEGSLRQRHPRRSRLAPSRALVYAEQVAQALDYAHHEHIIHRDVKPENMLIGPRGEILLSDFGIATLVANPASQSTPTIAGTWAYMAPEQFQGHPLPASDQYSLAVVVYEWLCGERPFRGEPLQIMTQHLQANPPPLRERNPAISPALEEAVHIALAKNPAQRYPTVSDFTTALRLALNPTRPIPNPPPSRRSTINKPDNPPRLSPPRGTTHNDNPSRLSPVEDHPRRGAIYKPDRPSRLSPTPLKSVIVSPPPEPPTVRPEHPAPEPSPHNHNPLTRRVILTGGLAALGGIAGSLIWWTRTHPTIITPTTSKIASNATPTGNNLPTTVPTLTTLLTYSNHTDIVDTVAWSPDGNYIASGSRDKTVQVWNAQTSQKLFIYTMFQNNIPSVTWSPDSKNIGVASFDGTIQIWPFKGGESALLYNTPNEMLFSVSWSPTGNRIAFAGAGGEVHIYEAPQGNEVSHYSTQSNTTYVVAWSSHDATLIASGSGGSSEPVQIWDIANGNKVAHYNKHTGGVFAVAWSPDGQYIASAGYDTTVQVWKVATGEQITVYDKHKGSINALAWSPDGQYIASGSNDSTVQVWSPLSGVLLHTYQKHSDAVRAVTWSPNGTRIASASADKTVRVWQAV